MGRWLDKETGVSFSKSYDLKADKSFNVIAATLYEHYDEALNFFVNRGTNAFAESFNAKIKAFRT